MLYQLSYFRIAIAPLSVAQRRSRVSSNLARGFGPYKTFSSHRLQENTT